MLNMAQTKLPPSGNAASAETLKMRGFPQLLGKVRRKAVGLFHIPTSSNGKFRYIQNESQKEQPGY
jgi:hypothetical protein